MATLEPWGELRAALHENNPSPSRIKNALAMFADDVEYEYAAHYALTYLLGNDHEQEAQTLTALCKIDRIYENVAETLRSMVPAAEQAADAIRNLGTAFAAVGRAFNQTFAPVAAAAVELDEAQLRRIAQAGMDGARAGRAFREQLGDGEEE